MKVVILLFFYIAKCSGEIGFADRSGNFSIDLLQNTQLMRLKNAVISPMGIRTLMTTIALGATDETYEQLVTALHLPQSRRGLAEDFMMLTKAVLDARPSTGVTMTSSNFVFIDKKNVRIDERYRRTVEVFFKATVKDLDFQDPSSVNIANSHIERAANVKNALYAGDFFGSKLILTNVVHFKGLWTIPFNVSDTVKEQFYDELKRPIGYVNMMYQKSTLPITNVDDLECLALEMPYGINKKYSMLFLLPYPVVKLTDTYKKLNGNSIKNIFHKLDEEAKEFGLEEIDICIPRFKINTNLVMNDALKNMGIKDAFEENLAKLKLISDDGLSISNIVHKAEIEVTESGTEASAISEAIFADKIAAPSFIADRPFMYFLVEKSSLTVIFTGVYSKPSLY